MKGNKAVLYPNDLSKQHGECLTEMIYDKINADQLILEMCLKAS